MERQMLSVRESVVRAKAEGLPISEYSLRLWIKQGLIPVRLAGRKQLIFWPNVRNYVTCADGVGDNRPPQNGGGVYG